MKRKISLVLAGLTLFAGLAVGCKGNQEEITVYMPDGAPALALAKLMAEDKEDDGVTYNVVPATMIASKVKFEDNSKNADLCVMPITAASKLLGKGEAYVMLGTVTHGNLYLLSTSENAKLESVNDLKKLLGKKLGTIQINNIPGLTLKTILKKNGIGYTEQV